MKLNLKQKYQQGKKTNKINTFDLFVAVTCFLCAIGILVAMILIVLSGTSNIFKNKTSSLDDQDKIRNGLAILAIVLSLIFFILRYKQQNKHHLERMENIRQNRPLS